MSTPAALCRHLGIEHPVLQAGTGDEPVIAVSEAGGLGVLGGAERRIAAETEAELRRLGGLAR